MTSWLPFLGVGVGSSSSDVVDFGAAVGLGVGEAFGDGLGFGVAVGFGVGDGLVVGRGFGVAEGFGVTVGFGAAVGLAATVGVGTDVGVAIGTTTALTDLVGVGVPESDASGVSVVAGGVPESPGVTNGPPVALGSGIPVIEIAGLRAVPSTGVVASAGRLAFCDSRSYFSTVL